MIASRVAIPGEENLFQLHVETYENVLPSDIRQAFSAMSKENPRFNHTIADLGTWLKEHGSPFQCEFSYNDAMHRYTEVRLLLLLCAQ